MLIKLNFCKKNINLYSRDLILNYFITTTATFIILTIFKEQNTKRKSNI